MTILTCRETRIIDISKCSKNEIVIRLTRCLFALGDPGIIVNRGKIFLPRSDGGGEDTELPPGTPRRQAKVTLCRTDPEEDQGVVYKVLVLGSHGVGKTTLTQQLLTSEYLPNSDNYAGKCNY